MSVRSLSADGLINRDSHVRRTGLPVTRSLRRSIGTYRHRWACQTATLIRGGKYGKQYDWSGLNVATTVARSNRASVPWEIASRCFPGARSGNRVDCPGCKVTFRSVWPATNVTAVVAAFGLTRKASATWWAPDPPHDQVTVPSDGSATRRKGPRPFCVAPAADAATTTLASSTPPIPTRRLTSAQQPAEWPALHLQCVSLNEA